MSRFIECQQGTPEWLQARAALCTASEFSTACETVGGLNDQQQKYVDLVLSGLSEKEAALKAGYKAMPTSSAIQSALVGELKLVPSEASARYAAKLAIEIISGVPHGEPPRARVLERGHIMEEEARRHYQAETGAFVTEAGICISEDGYYGYSTDGLVDDGGLIEIKAPIDPLKIFALLRTQDLSEYMHQMQGGMWVTEREWCDFIMYVPDLSNCGKNLFIKRVMRDDVFIAKMQKDLARFWEMAQANVAALKAA